jgi:hypothetical protein
VGPSLLLGCGLLAVSFLLGMSFLLGRNAYVGVANGVLWSVGHGSARLDRSQQPILFWFNFGLSALLAVICLTGAALVGYVVVMALR